MTKEILLTIITTCIIVFAILLVVTQIANLIGRAKIYTDKEHRERLTICLEKGDTFQDCYHGIYNKYANFEGLKK